MKKIHVIIEDTSLKLTSHHAITSVLYVESEYSSFPCKGWTELSSSVLDMWLSCLTEFLLYSLNETFLFFMDGPYMLKLTRISSRTARIEMIECGNVLLFDTVIDLSYFCGQVLSAAEVIRFFAEERNQRKINGIFSSRQEKLKVAMIQMIH